MKEILKFPKGFLWGSGTSSEQIEPNGMEQQGNKALNVFKNDFKNRFDMYYEGNYALNNFYEKYKGDLAIAKDLNFNSIRLSVSWALLQPTAGQELDEVAIDYYTDVFKEAKNNGLHLTITLFHFDMPMWAAEKGGWASREVVDDFVDFAKKVFIEFNGQVDYWAVFNEGYENTAATYLINKQPQFKGTDDITNYPKAIWHIAVATAGSVKAFREVGVKGPIGSVLVATNVYTKTDSKEDLRAGEIAEQAIFRVFSDPNILGVFPEDIWEMWIKNGFVIEDFRLKEDFDLIANNTIEWMGVNYYLPIRVKAPVEGEEAPEGLLNAYKDLFFTYRDESTRFNHDRGWEIYPKGIYDRFLQIKEYYGDIPALITEVGIGVSREERFRNEEGIIQDKYRIQFHAEHMYWTHKAIEEGCNVIGYQMWTYIDNWSFTNAYKNRYGFIEFDIKTGERKEKLSANWMRAVGSTNQLEFDINIDPEDDEIQKL